MTKLPTYAYPHQQAPLEPIFSDIKTLYEAQSQTIAIKQLRPHILMLKDSGERGIARVAGSVSSVESRWVWFIQSGSELQPPW
jgi:hypothetical protein